MAAARALSALFTLPGPAAALIVALLAALPAAAQEDAGEAVGRIGGLIGDARLVSAEGDSRPAAEGVPVELGDRVITGPGSRLELVFADGSRVVIGSTSDLSIERYLTSAGGTRRNAVLSLLDGILRAIVRPGGGEFEVESRAAVASVRSTELVVDVWRTRTAVFVREGRVDVLGRSGPLRTLEPGEGVGVRFGGPVPQPGRWSQERIDEVLARTSDP
ncbi:MAG: FecR family protein [Azospirillaceae bacterium]